MSLLDLKKTVFYNFFSKEKHNLKKLGVISKTLILLNTFHIFKDKHIFISSALIWRATRDINKIAK